MPHYNRDPKRDHNFDNHPLGDPITQLIAFKVIRDHTLLSVAGFGTTGRVESLFSGFYSGSQRGFYRISTRENVHSFRDPFKFPTPRGSIHTTAV